MENPPNKSGLLNVCLKQAFEPWRRFLDACECRRDSHQATLFSDGFPVILEKKWIRHEIWRIPVRSVDDFRFCRKEAIRPSIMMTYLLRNGVGRTFLADFGNLGRTSRIKMIGEIL